MAPSTDPQENGKSIGGDLNRAFVPDGVKAEVDGSAETKAALAGSGGTAAESGKGSWDGNGVAAGGGGTEVEAEVVDTPRTLKSAWPQILACSAKNMILLSYGMSLGFVTITIGEIGKIGPAGNNTNYTEDALRLDPTQTSWFGSINWIMVAVGGIVSGPFATPWGRKPAMIAVNFTFMLGYVIFHMAESVTTLYAAQAVCGFGGGLLEAPVLTYIAEISEPHLRGALSASTTAVLILGIFIDFLLGRALHWRTVALVNIVAPVMAVVALCFVPESPHWLIGKGRVEDAERALCWLRGWAQPAEVQKEMSLLVRTLSPGAGNKKSTAMPPWSQLLRRTFLVPYSIVVFAFFVGHWSGMTPLQTYAVNIFASVGTPIDKKDATVLIGLVELTGTLACVGLVHYTGKRPLALLSTLGAGLCFLVTAIDIHMHGEVDLMDPAAHAHPASWVPMVSLVASALISHVGIRILPWMLIGEVYPPEVKGFASGASGCMGYVVGFAANRSFSGLRSSLTLAGTFFLYSGVALVGTVMLYFFLPETEGHHLHEILEHFEGKRDLRTGRKAEVAGDPEKWAADNPAMSKAESRL